MKKYECNVLLTADMTS